LYIVKITPYIFNARVMGQCGAENPVIAAEVERNGKIILKEQRFASCIPDRRTIHRITFHERIESMQIAATLDEHFLPIRIERAFAYAGLPGYFEEAVFDTFPSGAAEADLFVAVQRGNINEVRQALEMGASPNARDERGFTPVAYLRKSGKEGLAQGRTQEELERDLDEIARLLFARGASGNVRSNNGHSLLEYLIHDASSTVIDLLLRNGADPKSDGSLRHAVVYGESELVGRLLVLGSDPNRKERDGLTALWFASRSGFDDFIDRPTPPIQDYIRCVRSLLMHGARVDAAVRDSEGLLWFMVRDYWQDERVKLILAELIPYSSKSAIASSYNLSVKIGTSKGSPSLSNWLGQFVRP
jgi:ankyrin repeat protein